MKSVILFFNLLIVSSFFSSAHAYFQELTDVMLKEIAMVRADPNWSTVVIFNPELCEQVGEACGFIKMHEFAHVKLNHGLLAKKSMYTRLTRNEADCWAAGQSKPEEVKAVVDLFTDENRDKSLRLYGDLKERATNIKACAKKANNWK